MSDALAIVIFVGAYVLIATEWVHRVVVALAGAGLMLLFKIVDANDAFHSDEFGIDWNVILLLFGMMIIIGVLRRTGLFEYLAILSAKRARGRPIGIMILLVVITAIASALLDNVTTMLLIAPVTVLLADRIGVSPVPLLVAEVFASNIGGTATLVGDPPNIIARRLTRAARCRAATKAPRKPQTSGPTPAVANESHVRPHGDQRVPVSFVDPRDPPGALCGCAAYSSNASICCARNRRCASVAAS